MSRGKKSQELTFEVVDAGEMSQEDADVVVGILARMIHDSTQKESTEQAFEVTESSGAGYQA